MNVKNEVLYLRKLYRRNKKILNCLARKTDKNKVNVHWWSMRRDNNFENVGDYLSIIICQYMLSRCKLTLDTSVNITKHLYTVGSIIQGGAQNAVIWGSGLKHGASDFGKLARLTRKLDIRLVRGPETRKALILNGYECPKLYGDPAIVMPLIYQPKETEKKDYLVILHHNTNRNILNSITPVTNNYKEFIDSIYNSKLVISSSLHGIILAETYGIPAILLTDRETNNMFKYNDYYYSTERFDYPVAQSIEEALALQPVHLPNLTDIRKNILNSFPYDLWN